MCIRDRSTLLRLLAGLEPPEQGSVALSPPSATVGYLPQEPDRLAGETVRGGVHRLLRIRDPGAPREEAADGLAGQPVRTPTRRRWSGGWASAGRISTRGPRRWRVRSGSAWTSTRR